MSTKKFPKWKLFCKIRNLQLMAGVAVNGLHDSSFFNLVMLFSLWKEILSYRGKDLNRHCIRRGN